ncbi:MAG: hypothetical protein ACJAU0_001266 [Flavobacteriales bacterium]|jgi:hypothetical protein
MNASSARFASALEIPAPSAIDSTNSALFILLVLYIKHSMNHDKYIG